MWGYIRQEASNGRKTWMSEEWVAGLHFAVLHCGHINTPLYQYRLVHKLRRMRAWGVRQSIVPREWETLCLREGIRPVTEAPLRQALMEPLWDRFCQERNLCVRGNAVCLQGKRNDAVVEQATIMIARKVRYLVLELEEGQAQMEDWLRNEYGLCVGCCGHSVVAKICCDKTSVQSIPTLWLGEGCERYQRVTYRLNGIWQGKVEENPQLLTVLWTEGKLTPEDIAIKSVESYA